MYGNPSAISEMTLEHRKEFEERLFVEWYTSIWYWKIGEQKSSMFRTGFFFRQTQIPCLVFLKHRYNDVDACRAKSEHLIGKRLVAPGPEDDCQLCGYPVRRGDHRWIESKV